jgi:tRNA threonylcarbamoyladenosine biosynthesis protein TsaB
LINGDRLVLVIDTSLSSCQVGIFSSGKNLKALWEISEPMQRGHDEALTPLVSKCFLKTGINIKALAQIIVTLGPGSFTGLRIGLAFAKGMAKGAALPLAGVGTLSSFLANPRAVGLEAWAIMANGRGHYYRQTHESDGKISDVEIFTGQAIDENDGPDILTGPQAANLSLVYPNARVLPHVVPRLMDIAILGMAQTPPYDIRPQYMRTADAKPSAKPVLELKQV